MAGALVLKARKSLVSGEVKAFKVVRAREAQEADHALEDLIEGDYHVLHDGQVTQHRVKYVTYQENERLA